MCMRCQPSTSLSESQSQSRSQSQSLGSGPTQCMRPALFKHLCMQHATLAAAVLTIAKVLRENELSVLKSYTTVAGAEL